MSPPKKDAPAPVAKKPFVVPLYAPPARRAEQGRAVELPRVEAPSLEGLTATLPAPEELTLERVQARFSELARPLATERAREYGERLQWGDEVLLNLVGYRRDGRILPFSVKTELWAVLQPEPMLPGLYESLVNQVPGEGLVVQVPLPDTYPVESLRGELARFLVHIQAAREVKYPHLPSPEFLQAFGRGSTPEEATRGVMEQMVREQREQARLQAQRQVLDEVARRTQVRLGDALIDEEIRRRWGASEGQAMLALELSDAEQEQALEGWLRDPATRAEAEQRLRIGLALGAIREREGLTLTPERVRELVRQGAEAEGLTLEEVSQSLRDDPQNQARLEQMALHLMTVEHVMSKARILQAS